MKLSCSDSCMIGKNISRMYSMNSTMMPSCIVPASTPLMPMPSTMMIATISPNMNAPQNE